MPRIKSSSRQQLLRTILPASCLTALLGGALPARADAFIRRFITANHGCTFELPFVLAGGGLQAPFGKPAGQWTDADLATLRQELAACQAEARATGNPYTAQEVDQLSRDIAARVPELVRKGRAEVQRQTEQLNARAALAHSETKQFVDALATLESQVEAAETQARVAQGQAKLRMQALQLRKQKANEAVARARAETARLESDVEQRERAAQAEADRATAAQGTKSVKASTSEAGPGILSPQPPAQDSPQAAPLLSGRQAQSTPAGEMAATGGPPPIRAGDHVTVKLGYMACRSVEDLDQVKTLDDRSSAEAATDYGLDHGCRAVPTGNTLEVQHFSLEHGAYCVRSSGEPECYWIPTWSLLGVDQ